MDQEEAENLTSLLAIMKEQKLPSTDVDVLHKERGEKEWSGTEYNATAADLEAFNDNIGDNGLPSVENVGDVSEFGNGYVEITFLHEESSEEGETSSRIRAYKLDFQCDVSLLLCLFEEGEACDGGIDWTERAYNYYDLQSKSRDPSDESHGYFEELKSDVGRLEIYE